MRFHLQPKEPNQCKCGNTVAPGLDWCEDCDEEYRDEALNYQDDMARGIHV